MISAVLSAGAVTIVLLEVRLRRSLVHALS
jgi:hypothetical protein